MELYIPKTDDELKQLAQDTFQNRIFWATQAPPDMIGSIFMVLALSTKEQLQPLLDLNAVPYEYMEKAGQRSVNGYPTFFSMQWLTGDDYNKMFAKYKAIKEAVGKA